MEYLLIHKWQTPANLIITDEQTFSSFEDITEHIRTWTPEKANNTVSCKIYTTRLAEHLTINSINNIRLG